MFRWLPIAWLAFAAPQSDVVCSLGPNLSSYKPAQDLSPTPDAMQLIRKVSAAYESVCLPKCPAVAIYRNPTAPNVILLAPSNGAAKLVYAPPFFSTVYGQFGEGAILALVGHVYGHAIDETVPSNWMKKGWSAEIRADAWTGCALAKINPDSNGLTGALTALQKYPPTAQASWLERSSAVRTGYVYCGGDSAKLSKKN